MWLLNMPPANCWLISYTRSSGGFFPSTVLIPEPSLTHLVLLFESLVILSASIIILTLANSASFATVLFPADVSIPLLTIHFSFKVFSLVSLATHPIYRTTYGDLWVLDTAVAQLVGWVCWVDSFTESLLTLNFFFILSWINKD